MPLPWLPGWRHLNFWLFNSVPLPWLEAFKSLNQQWSGNMMLHTNRHTRTHTQTDTAFYSLGFAFSFSTFNEFRYLFGKSVWLLVSVQRCNATPLCTSLVVNALAKIFSFNYFWNSWSFEWKQCLNVIALWMGTSRHLVVRRFCRKRFGSLCQMD